MKIKRIFSLSFCMLITMFLLTQKIICCEEIKFGGGMSISRACVARILALSFCDLNLNENQKRVINFIDTNPTKWYDKYINLVFDKKLMNGEGDKFFPEENLSIIQTQYLLDKINPENKIKIKITDENKNKNISYALWVKLFCDAISGLDNKLENKKITVLATHAQNKKIPEDYLITDQQFFSCEGMCLDSLVDKSLEVLVRNNKIAMILSSDCEIDLDANIIKQDNEKIFLSSGPVKRIFDCNLHKKIFPGFSSLKIKSGSIIDIALRVCAK